MLYTRKITLTFILIICAQFLFGQSGWRKYGWQIFESAGEGRLVAMGGASISDDNMISTLWNPAIISGIESTKITYGHQSRFAGIIQSDLISFRFTNKSNKKFNLLILHESVGKIPKTSDLLLDWGLDGVPNTGDQGENNGILDEGERIDNDKITYFNQHQVGIQFNSMLSVSNYEFGIGVRGLLHTLGNNWGSGVGLDVGIIRSYWENSQIGLTIRNVIPAMVIWDSGTIELTKPILITGLSQDLNIDNIDLMMKINFDLLVNFDDRSLNDDFNISSSGGNFRVGTELSYKNKFNLRFGRNQFGYLSTGIGLNWTYFDLNYGYQLNSASADLGSNHVISFDIDPEWIFNVLKN